MQVSFSEFVLRYLDEWNLEAGCLAEDLYICHHSLNAWMYQGQIPSNESIRVIREYFGADFEGVVFDGKAFKRKHKITRTDGSSKVYDTRYELSVVEDVSINSITKYCRHGGAIIKGRNKGCKFERVYEELEVEEV